MGLTKEYLSPGGRLDEVGRWQAQHLQQVQCGCVTIAESQIQRLSRSRWDSGQTLSFTFKAQKIKVTTSYQWQSRPSPTPGCLSSLQMNTDHAKQVRHCGSNHIYCQFHADHSEWAMTSPSVKHWVGRGGKRSALDPEKTKEHSWEENLVLTGHWFFWNLHAYEAKRN